MSPLGAFLGKVRQLTRNFFLKRLNLTQSASLSRWHSQQGLQQTAGGCNILNNCICPQTEGQRLHMILLDWQIDPTFLLCVDHEFWGWYFVLYAACLSDAGLSGWFFFFCKIWKKDPGDVLSTSLRKLPLSLKSHRRLPMSTEAPTPSSHVITAG